MESTAKPSVYISAYPLKAVRESNIANHPPQSPYLKALLSRTLQPDPGRLRVITMWSAQKKYDPLPTFDQNKLPKDIELTEKNWFINYE